MKLVILAAGVGSRLFPLTQDMPKSLLELGDGTTLLERQYRVASLCPQIKKILVVVGYQHQAVEKYIEKNKNTFKNVHLEFNPFFEMSDNMMTLWTVKHLLTGQDFIVSNGDNLYKEHVLRELVEKMNGQEGVFVVVNRKDRYDSDDMKVLFQENGLIARVHKQINPTEAQADSVGLVLVKGLAAQEKFLEVLTLLAKRPEGMRFFWLEILNQLVLQHYPVKPIFIIKEDWREMDFHPDLVTIRENLLKNLF